MSHPVIACIAFALTSSISFSQPPAVVPPDLDFEVVPIGEADLIKKIVNHTMEGMKRDYANQPPVLRGVHPKDHGCVTATFEVLKDLNQEYAVGIFSKPGQQYKAYIRYSNAGLAVKDDSPKIGNSDKREHASRGMAIKLMKVEGNRLIPRDEPMTQDFLMINQPVFASPNAEDYEALRREKDPADFFKSRMIQMDDSGQRARESFAIVQRIRDLTFDESDKHAILTIDCQSRIWQELLQLFTGMFSK